ncbi:YceI family protein [Kangiella sp. TOML190]|uniref:YceI family protein n=1 Tax=Kangiella sp. TOML190 TaxID=2931351 RepID=UPI00203E54EB|nr:YceI family protein [Kangiella sp. TOML190]
MKMLTKNGISCLLALLLLVLLSACASLLAPKVKNQLIELQAGQYQLDKNHASLLFRVKHLGLSDYVGRFNDFDASLDFDPQDPLSMQLQAVINSASIDVNNPEFEDTLKGSSWLNSQEFPQASFTSQSIKQVSDNQFIITGSLLLNGIRKLIDINLIFNGGANNFISGKYTLGFSARVSFLRSEFGIDQYLGLVGDEVLVEVDGEFYKR